MLLPVLQACVELDFYVAPKGVRNGANLICLASGVLELLVAYTGHLAPHIEVHGGYLEGLVVQQYIRLPP